MIAVRLMKAEEYLPKLEEIGLVYIEIIVLKDVPHSVFQTPKGTRFIYPGVRGYDDEIPMIPALKMDELIEAAQNIMNCESNPKQHDMNQ